MPPDKLIDRPPQQFRDLSEILAVVGNGDIEGASAALPMNRHIQLAQLLRELSTVDGVWVETDEQRARAWDNLFDAANFTRKESVEKRQRRFETLKLNENAGTSRRKEAHMLSHESHPRAWPRKIEAGRHFQRAAHEAPVL